MRVLALLFLILASSISAANGQVPLVTESSDTSPTANTAGLDALIDIIEADPAGAALLARVRATAIAEQLSAESAETSEATIARQVAEYTRGAAEGVSNSVQSLGSVFSTVGSGLSGASSANFEALMSAVIDVVIVGGAVFGSLLVLRLLSFWCLSQVERRITGRTWLRKSAGLAIVIASDFLSVMLAWGAGYFVALLLAGDGRMGINQTLLLNAFLLVETIKVATRAILVPRFSQFRLLPIADTSAGYWAFWSSRVVSLVGYTFMFVVPIIAASISVVLASTVEVLVVVTVAIIAILVVLQNKDDVRAMLTTMAEKCRRKGLAQILLLTARYWHVVAIVYLCALLVAWLANPAQALPFIVSATIQTIVAIAAGMLVIGFVRRFVNVGLRLPGDITERLPLLEQRLRAYVPRIMQVVRLVVLSGVIIAIAQVWSLFDFLGWISSENGQYAAGALVSAVAIVLIGIAIHVATASWVEYRLNPNYGSVPTAREKTLLSLFKNAMTITLVVFVSMLALAQIGVNIAPLLAGAGVLGLAIGFGAQKFVQDIITGAFIQLENVMNEGDVVEAGGKSGVVERLTIRSVSIRDLSGTLHLIPFSSVDQVSNSMKDFAYHLAQIRVAYHSDIATAKQAIEDAYGMLMETEHKDHVLGPLEMHGITEFLESSIIVRARIKTLPGSQWAAGRAFNEFVKQIFDERGIEIPFPQVTMHAPKERPPMQPVGPAIPQA